MYLRNVHSIGDCEYVSRYIHYKDGRKWKVGFKDHTRIMKSFECISGHSNGSCPQDIQGRVCYYKEFLAYVCCGKVWL